MFRSGLRLLITDVPPGELVNGLATEWKVSPARLEAAYGHESTKSDYNFVRSIYESTPDKIHYWGDSSLREHFLITVKTAALMKSAMTGIFRLKSRNFQGFQQGDPRAVKGVVIDLYSDRDHVQFIIGQSDPNSAAFTQPEINRIVQSVRRVMADPSSARN
jgi:hypothetical protein